MKKLALLFKLNYALRRVEKELRRETKMAVFHSIQDTKSAQKIKL